MSSTDSSANKFQSIAQAVSQVLLEGHTAALATLVVAAPEFEVGTKILIREGAKLSQGGLGNDALDQAVIQQAATFLASKFATRLFQVKDFAPSLTDWSEASVLFERIQPEPRLVICGAGHVGAALARLANLLAYRITLIDDRAEFVSRSHYPDGAIELVAAENWSQAVTDAIGNGHGVSIAIVTRGHSEDEQCLRAVMSSAEVDYIGLIGSKRRTNIVLQRLRDSGAPEKKLSQVHAPVGLDIGAVTPEEVALAIMAEIVAVRRGGKGGSLSAWRRVQSEGSPW
ncbi:MAG TPA: XdhC family protein [Pyrinomonadaceae bacterium]|nr:XdhC family protein [Pyrinomonadaceae bacterium]